MIHSGGLYVSGWKSQKPIVALEVQEAQNQSVLAGNRYLRNSQCSSVQASIVQKSKPQLRHLVQGKVSKLSPFTFQLLVMCQSYTAIPVSKR
jgi:hypothetical protein